MAGQGHSVQYVDQDGNHILRRSQRTRKPRNREDMVELRTPRRRQRGSTMMVSSGSRPQGQRATGARNQGRRSLPIPQHQSSDSDSDEENDFSDGYDSTDTIDNLEVKVYEVSRENSKNRTDLDFFIKLIFSELPRDAIQKLRDYARVSERGSDINNFLNDLNELNSANVLNRCQPAGSTNGDRRGSGVQTYAHGIEPPRAGPAVPPNSVPSFGADREDQAHPGSAAPPTSQPFAGADRADQVHPPAEIQQQQQQQQPQQQDGHGNPTADFAEQRRRRSIIIKGLNEDLIDGDAGGFNRLLDTMDLGYIKGMTYQARRIGRQQNNRSRLIIVTFENEAFAQRILNARWKLFFTNNSSQWGNFSTTYVEPDLTREERQRLFEQRQIDRENRDRNNANGGEGGGQLQVPRPENRTDHPRNETDSSPAVDQQTPEARAGGNQIEGNRDELVNGENTEENIHDERTHEAEIERTENVNEGTPINSQAQQTRQPNGATGVWATVTGTPRRLLNSIWGANGSNAVEQGNESRAGETAVN